MLTKKQIEKVLDTILDPELAVSIFQLGLIYTIEIEKENVHILMTLTSIGCPLFDQIAVSIREEVLNIHGVRKVDIDLTFEPPWSPDRMSTEAKMQLGF